MPACRSEGHSICYETQLSQPFSWPPGPDWPSKPDMVVLPLYVYVYVCTWSLVMGTSFPLLANMHLLSLHVYM